VKGQKRVRHEQRRPGRIPAAILEAYRATTFWVEAPSGRIALRDGEPSAQLDELLVKHGVESCAFITAWNPKSRQLAAGENARRQRELERRATKQGYAILPGVGAPDDGSWTPERSCLVLGITRAAALRLGAAAGQYAIVVGREAKPAKVVSCLSV